MLKTFIQNQFLFLKNLIKRLPLPIVLKIKSYLFLFRLLHSYSYDFLNYLKFSLINNQFSERALIAMIQIDFHAIEKGLSHYKIKNNFGKGRIKNIIFLCDQYFNRYGFNTIFLSINDAFDEYIDKVNPTDIYIINLIKLFKDNIKPHISNEKKMGGTKITKNKLKLSFNDYKDFVSHRVSCRQFLKKKIPLNIFRELRKISNQIPTVCNRQPCEFIIVPKKNHNDVVTMQAGGASFANEASNIIVVTSDLHAFNNFTERNQPYFETGTYALNLTYALTSLGLSTCYLNWNVPIEVDKKLKKLLGIPSNKVIGTLIAVGYSRKPAISAFSNKY